MAFSDFSQIRKTRGGLLNTLIKEVEKLDSGSGSSADDRFWQPDVDKAGNGQATIRFLPAAPENDYPWVRVFSHGFKNEQNGKWFIAECPTTIGLECPVCARNSELWNTNIKENQELVRSRKRKLQYIANVLIVKDSKNPQNEGQVKLFKFGKKIFDKIKEAMQPKFEDQTPIDPFDFWEGANFKLRICNVEGYRNYDRSEFDGPSAVSDDDSEVEAIWKKQHDLRSFLDSSKFKSFEDLERNLDQVLGNAAPIKSAQQQAMEDLESFVPRARQEEPKASESTPAVPPRNRPAAPLPAQDDDDDAAFFANLMNGDND